MKAILKYNLPEEARNHLCAVHGERLAYVLWEFIVNGHREYKYDDNKYYEGITKAQQTIKELLEEEGIDIEVLTF